MARKIIWVGHPCTKHYIKTGSRGETNFESTLSQEDILPKVITAPENNQSVPNINLRESISEILKAWNYMMSMIVPFITVLPKFDSLSAVESLASTEDEDYPIRRNEKKIWIQLKEKQEITNDVLLDNFRPLDSEGKTSGSLIESVILKSLKNKTNTTVDCNEKENEDENDDNAEINKPLYDLMINSFESI
ncbi:tigger transposable element-derived protein 4 [Trichonephila clavipes]|uniref:Tigger transposable element-derived protein 4 n=1 Tax=Trichonephila clavipes TaxID=2585209 RepID=A0A8X6WKV8_TRICX|nr:tigger transposable element-derived protein 4 [Trichonephila clavipes]